MIVVLIHWRIKPDKVSEFVDFWKTQATVNDRSGLIEEILSQAKSSKDFDYITWHLDPESDGNFISFVNVGIWLDDDAFEQQIGKYFNDDNPLRDFEQLRRRRIVLRPTAWRIGKADLPSEPAGVL
jgi:hypothetical protein